MLSTPLLTLLSNAYPQARFDWAISDSSRQAIAGNPRLTELVRTCHHNIENASWQDLQDLIHRLRVEAYDTCIIPSRSSLLAWIAWQAQIPQRIGLSAGGRGFSHTLAVKYPAGEVHEAAVYLEIAKAMGLDTGVGKRIAMEYYPPDSDRTAVTQRLIDKLNWLGDRPLVVMHPGGGDGTTTTDNRKQWPL
ncbi:MAG: glycosyltransferase family 9 protein, partial [Chloroflexi bacterium]|nr:glycosyltransferase family 9 protein [Chloroflexota bacterium]